MWNKKLILKNDESLVDLIDNKKILESCFQEVSENFFHIYYKIINCYRNIGKHINNIFKDIGILDNVVYESFF